MNLPLFSYGTLRDAELQRELFDRTYETVEATLSGYDVVAMPGGFYSARPNPIAAITGALVSLDAAGYTVADRWEDLEVYVRVTAVARDAHGIATPCFLYLRPDADGEPVTELGIAAMPRAHVIEEIRRFRATRER